MLPNNPNVVAVAEQAAAHSAKKVRVVPTAGIPRRASPHCWRTTPKRMWAPMRTTWRQPPLTVVAGEVVQASRDAMSDAGPVKEGDWLGVSRDGHRSSRPGPATAADAAIALLGHPRIGDADHEIVTIIEGEGGPPSPTPAASSSGCRKTTRGALPRCTMGASRSTPTFSASSECSH